MSNTLLTTDILIVGGGLVGSALACALGQEHIKVILIDRDQLPTLQSAELDGRSTAISLSSQRLLKIIGVWNEIIPYAGTILSICVADGGSSLTLKYDYTDVGCEPLGWIIENSITRRALLKCLSTLPTVKFLTPVLITEMSRSNSGVYVLLSNGYRVAARLLVAADGRTSPTRTSAGIGLTTWRYNQSAIVCTILHQNPHNNTAYEHFMPSGPFAVLPLVNPYKSSIVWTEKSWFVSFLMSLSSEAFLSELRTRFSYRFGDIQTVSQRFSYPLSLQLANTYTAQRLVLAGDSAHSMHPLAGQGFNMGIRDAAALSEIVIGASRARLDIGSSIELARYQCWRQFDNLAMLAITDSLNCLFSNNISLLKIIRDLGLTIVNQIPAIKRLLIRHATGTIGNLPRLLKGMPL